MAKKNLLPTLASLFLSVGLLASEQALSFEYKINDSTLKPKERAAIQALLDRAEAMLPAKMKNAIPVVNVEIKRIELPVLTQQIVAAKKKGSDLACNKEDDEVADTESDEKKIKIAGHATRNGTITINRYFLTDIVDGPVKGRQSPDRQHKSFYEEALATVIHETTHVYDLQNIHSKEENDWIIRCRVSNQKSEPLRTYPDECAAYRGIYTTFSQNPYFLQVAGWVGLDFNGFTQRSVDSYETQNPKENFAVNTEFFLMDPEFKCRKPSMYRLLKNHFQHEPFAGVSCDNKLGYVVPGNGADKAQFLTIDPARVYQVHYLLADKGEATMSGWGHAMIRLVICADGRTVGPDCLLDVDKSVVLSYRAFIDSMNLSSWDGLRGKYPSRLFIIPLKQVTDEYAMGELRALESIPLKMSRKEIENFVVRSVEAHWAYDGKYYFISNNCATETLNLLKGSLLKPNLVFSDIRELDPQITRDKINPIGLKSTLVNLGLADDSVLKDRKDAMLKGFYFDSFEDRFNKIYGILKNEMHVGAPTFKEYLNFSAQQRSSLIARIDRSNPRFLQHTAAFLMFETASARKLETKIKAEIQKVVLQEMEESKKTCKKGKVGQIADGYLEVAQLFATPSIFLMGQPGYGLPVGSELASATQKIDTEGKRSEEIAKTAQEISDSLISPADIRELDLIKANLTTLRTIIRPAKPAAVAK